LYHKSPQEALKMISSIDQDRALYLRQFTGQNWLDTTHYHLSLDTSAVGLWKAEAIILETLQARFNDIILEDKR
jgi:3-methyladenine DNA glycosylase AlkC